MKMKLLLASVPFIALIFQVTPVQAQQNNENKATNERSSIDIRSVTTSVSGETLINYTEDGHRYKIKMNGTKILEMYVDEKKVAEEDYSKYDATIKKILAQIEKDREQARKDREQATEDRKQAEKDRQQAEKDREQAMKDREQANSNREQTIQDRQKAQKDREQSETDRQKADTDRLQAVEDRKQADKDRLQAVEDRKQAEKDREQANKDRFQAEIDRKHAEEDRKLMNEMIDEMVKEKLIDNKEALKSMTLDENEFIVNGTKQSESLHSKFKTKYLKSSRGRINYRNSNGSRGISIDQ